MQTQCSRVRAKLLWLHSLLKGSAAMDNTRDEMRRLIDVIEKGARSASVAQVIDDMKTFPILRAFWQICLIHA